MGYLVKTKAFSKSDSVAVKDAVGFQPDLIYIGTGGTLVLHVNNAGTKTDESITVYDGQWWPADNIERVNSTTTTASGFVAWQQ